MTSGPPCTLAAAPRGTSAAAPRARTAPAVVPACTTSSLPARVMQSCGLDTVDSLKAGEGWLPDATGVRALRGLTGPARPGAARRPSLLRHRRAAIRRNRWRGAGGGHHAPFGRNYLRSGPAPGHGRPPDQVLRRPAGG